MPTAADAVRPGAVHHPNPPPGRDVDAWRAWLEAAMAPWPERLRHSLTVWERARAAVGRDLPFLDPERAARLTLAALLHDAGRALDPFDREPHGVVGARLLDAAGLGDVAALLAHHSGGRFEPVLGGSRGVLGWPEPDVELLAVLTYLDRTTSSGGEQTCLVDRRKDMVRRYGPESRNVVVFDLSLPDALLGRRILARRAPADGAELAALIRGRSPRPRHADPAASLSTRP